MNVKEIPLDLLVPDPMNIREAPKLDEEFLASVRKGVIQPLVVRPVSSIQDREARKKLEEEGKQYVVTAGVRRYVAAVQLKLKAVPCVVKEMGDLEARCLSIAENRHRKDIPEWRWTEIIGDLYDRLEGSKMERYQQIHELTGMGESTVREHLLVSNLPKDFRSRLKEPEERSVSEKEALKKIAVPQPKEKIPLGEKEEKPPLEEVSKKDLEEPPRVPMKVMVQMVRDENFRKLMKTEPAKAHALLTEAAKKGRNRIGEVLRLAKEWKFKPKEPIERAVRGVDYVDLEISATVRLIGADFVRALEIYRQEKGLEDLPSAAKAVLYEWIVEQTSTKYVDFPASLAGAMLKYLTRWRYTDRAMELLKKEREGAKK